jgi:hypothetical protein
MADNVAITAGAGTTVAADEVADGTLGTVKVQFVKLMDGTLDGTNKQTVTSRGASLVEGPTAADVAIAAPPLTIGGRASTATPTAVSTDGDVVNGWFDLYGRQHTVVDNASIAGTAGTPNAGVLSVQGITGMTAVNVKSQEIGSTRVSKRVAITASQTGTAVWTPTSGWRFVLTLLWVSAKTAGDLEMFDATDSGNTVISPITTLNVGGGYIMQWAIERPYRSAAVNNVLKYTTGTVITGSIYVEGWEENA